MRNKIQIETNFKIMTFTINTIKREILWIDELIGRIDNIDQLGYLTQLIIADIEILEKSIKELKRNL